MSCPPPSVSNYACFTHAKQQEQRSQASNAAKATTNDQTDQKGTKGKPQNQNEKQKGLGANPGHKQSQNSHQS